MIDTGTIQFSQYYMDTDNSVTHTIRGDSSLDEVIEAFEYFLKGAGYQLPEGCHIGYEYDDDMDDEADFDIGLGADVVNISDFGVDTSTITLNTDDIDFTFDPDTQLTFESMWKRDMDSPVSYSTGNYDVTVTYGEGKSND